AAASTTARPSSSRSHRAGTGRPSGSDTRFSCHLPPSALWRASAVPSPPSATGSSTASPPPSRTPRASDEAAAPAERTPLRLAGHRSALPGLLVLEVVDHLPHRLERVLGRVLVLLHAAEHRERDSFTREEDQPEPDADGHLDGLQHEPVREPCRVRD